MKKVILALFFATILSMQLYPQCFSNPGNPIGGAANMGTLTKKASRLITFYQYQHAKGYFKGNEKSSLVLVDRAFYNFVSSTFAYGISDKLTLEAEAGYFINKTMIYDPSIPLDKLKKRGYGFSNGVLSLKYNIFTDVVKFWSWSASAGLKVPLRMHAQVIDNIELAIDAQPTVGSFGTVFQSYLIKQYSLYGLRFFLFNRVELNFKNHKNFFINKQQYKFGNTYINSVFVSKHLMHPSIKGDWTFIAQIRDEFRSKNRMNDQFIDASGSHLVYFTPQLNFTYKKLWNFSVSTDIPVYRYYNEVQLANSYAVMFVLSKDFSLYVPEGAL